MSNDGDPASPRLTPVCRSFLRLDLEGAEAREHLAACAFCAARNTAKTRLAALLAVAPEPPARLRSAAFLDDIRAAIVEASEASATGQLLAAAIPVAAPQAVEHAWPEDLMSSELGRRTLSRPAAVADPAWARVKASVLSELASHQAPAWRRSAAVRNRGLALAGVAVAAIICTWLAADGTQPAPEIVIADVAALPDAALPDIGFSPMVVLRQGRH